jgi:hypothetical protein
MQNIVDQDTTISLIETDVVSFLSEIEQRKIQNISETIKSGYGACRSCDCKGWKPNYPKNDYCKNCGHHWERHS